MSIPFIDEDAPNIMKELKKCYKISIVSARNPEYEAPIVSKLKFHNVQKGIHYEDLILLNHKPYDIKLTLDYDIYIDDNPNLVEPIKKLKGKRLLLYDQPWNQNISDSKNILRVFSWRDIKEDLNCKG
jgi:5'(3')-deoxyribonucleotidase